MICSFTSLFEFTTFARDEPKCEIAPLFGRTPHTVEVCEAIINEVHKVNSTGASLQEEKWTASLGGWRTASGHSLEARQKSAGRYHSTVTGSVVLLPLAVGPQPAHKAGSAFVLFHVAEDAVFK